MKSKSKTFKIFTIIILALLVFLIAAPHLVQHDPFNTDLSHRFLKPGDRDFLMGTDSVGRCIGCRVLAGGIISVFSALAVTFIVFMCGTFLGTVSGYMGGYIDAVIGKITVIFQAFPSFVLAVAIAGILGPGLINGIIALSMVYWTTYCRLSRSLVLSVKRKSYVRAAQICGAGNGRIILKYILPDVIPQLIVTAMMDIGNVILSMAGLSFIGLAAKRPTAEWGAMISESRSYFQTAPYTVILPGIAIFLTVIIFNLYGDLLRDYLKRKEF